MKRIATIQDISCFGKCSITVALPIISAMGIECCIIPTSVLSTHTGGFSGYTSCDISAEILPIAEHWRALDLSLDAIYTGYLASKEQVELIKRAISLLKKEETLIFVDPAMADNGALYAGFDADFPKKMLELCLLADVIAPNVTEACLLLGKPCLEEGRYDEDDVRTLIDEFAALGISTVVITGVKTPDGQHGAVAYSAAEDRCVSYFADHLPRQFHGAGDTFSSVLCGSLVKGADIFSAIKRAIDFTLLCIKKTDEDYASHPYGVKFEECIASLCAPNDADREGSL